MIYIYVSCVVNISWIVITHAAELFRDVQPYVQSTLDGHNVSILAYGQTFSGKTHTMVGFLSPSI